MGGVIAFVFFIGLAIVQLAAFGAGVHEWLGWPWYAAAGIGLIALFFGQFGLMFIAIVGFFGAQAGWGWEWWQAFLLCFPTVTFMLFSVVTVGASAITQAMLGRGRT